MKYGKRVIWCVVDNDKRMSRIEFFLMRLGWFAFTKSNTTLRLKFSILHKMIHLCT